MDILMVTLEENLRLAVILSLRKHHHEGVADELNKLPLDIASFDGISREVVTILCAIELISGEIHHTMQSKA